MKKLKRFFRYYKPHKKLFVLDLICSFLIALCNLFYPFITRVIINDFVPNKILTLILVWGGVLLAVYAVKAILNYIVGYYGHVLGVRIQADMRRQLFRHIQTLPFSYFDDNKTCEDVFEFKCDNVFPRIEKETGIKASDWFFQLHSEEVFEESLVG